jgi:hypothetical protein
MWKIVTENLLRGPRTMKGPNASADGLAELAGQVDALAQKRLGRSLSIREVDAGSCNGCELEIHALNNPLYDLERFGLRFVASPRHADLLLVTGPVTHNMAEAPGAPTTPRRRRSGLAAATARPLRCVAPAAHAVARARLTDIIRSISTSAAARRRRRCSYYPAGAAAGIGREDRPVMPRFGQRREQVLHVGRCV